VLDHLINLSVRKRYITRSFYHHTKDSRMGHDSLLQSIASSGQAIISNVKSYDMKLQQVPSLLSGPLDVLKTQCNCLIFRNTGFMESYGSISSTFSPKPMSFNVDWNRCVANNSQATHPHCAAVQAFVIDISVIGSVAVFTLLVMIYLA
jgi:hypothetical protein